LSPAAARTSNEAIVAAARVLLEAGGPEAVTMQAVADAVGVRAPSLYKRVADRSALLTALADDIATDLAAAVAVPARIPDPRRALRQMAARYRAFAHRQPHSYQLLFGAAGTQPSAGANALAAAGVLRVIEALVGPADALEAARLMVAYAHGFVSMELSGAFRLGGDVDDAFDYGIDTLIRGLTSHPG
jgi:AcrR family transcriptional regulator